MNCDDIELLVFDYVNKDLSANARRRVDKHLAECPVCALKMEMAQSSLSLLDQWAPPKLSEDFADQLAEQIQLPRKPFWEKLKEKIFLPVHIKMPVQAMAAAALIFLVIIAYRIDFMQRPETIPRNIVIDTIPVEVDNPIIIEVSNIEDAVGILKQNLETLNGNLIKRRWIQSGLEVVVRVDHKKEKFLFEKFHQLGTAQLQNTGFKDNDGNIVIILKTASD